MSRLTVVQSHLEALMQSMLEAVRFLLTPAGQLVATAEVLAESVEPGELKRLVAEVTGAAERLGALVEAVYAAPDAGAASQQRIE